MMTQALNKKLHNRKQFDCGSEALNNYLKQTAKQHDDIDLSRCFVLTYPQDNGCIVGFYSLSVCYIKWDELPEQDQKKYPKNGISGALIGRLAVDKHHQRKGYGGYLLIDAITRIITSGADIPHPVIIVDAKNDQAKDFYLAFGFEEIAPNSNRLYMPTKHAKQMLEQA